MLAVITVFSDQFLAGITRLTDQVAVGVVVVATLEQVFVTLVDAACLQTALFVVLVLAEQPALALLFATGAELVRGQA